MLTNNKEIYLIKDLAGLSGLSIYTVKYYLKLGLIKEVGKTPGSNFRYFDNTNLETLKHIRSLKLKGYSLNSIKEELSKNLSSLILNSKD